jgi:type VI secretion system secreted protein Hcp
MPIFMHYPEIPGDVTTKGHEKWIELSTCILGNIRTFTNPSKSGYGDREADTPIVTELGIAKLLDDASIGLWCASLGFGPAGEGQTVQIDFCKTDTSQPEPYLQLTLENTLISSYGLSGAGDRPTETLNLNFTKVEFKYTGMGPANDTGTPQVASYDLAALAPA